MRYLGLMKATPETEAGVPPSRELIERMGAFMEEVVKAGVLKSTDGLHPSARAVKLNASGGKVTVTDGPFTETKELVASYALFEVQSKEEAIEWTRRFLEVLGEGECTLYQVFEATDFPPELFSPEEAASENELRRVMESGGQR